jgi:hypothetical protein
MHALFAFAWSFLGLLPIVSTSALGQDQPPPASIRIDSLSYQGNGCPSGSVAANLSPDRKAFTVLFDQFIADSTRSQQPKTCRIGLNFSYPRGWTFTLYRIDLRGYAALTTGATGKQQASYQFGNGSLRALGDMHFSGPYDDNYYHASVLSLQNLSWAPCTAGTSLLRLNTQIQAIAGPGSNALMTVDSIDGDTIQTYAMKWRRCDRPADSHQDYVPMYRAYNAQSGFLFYTINKIEYDSLVSAGWRGEGVAFLVAAYATDPRLAPIHRLYNPNSGQHYYTINEAEKNYLVSIGWRFELIAGYMFANEDLGTVPVYRVYNRISGGHLFTSKAAEAYYWVNEHPEAYEMHSPLGFVPWEIE